MNCFQRDDSDQDSNDDTPKLSAIMSNPNYKPSFQRLVDANKNYLYTAVRVRVFFGDAEKDIVLKIRNQDLHAKDICSTLEKLLKIPAKYGTIFRLWIFGKDLELQLDPDQNITELLLKWHVIMLQYTHYMEAASPKHCINRYFFVYKRVAILPRSQDLKAFESEIVTKLLYGEAKRNFLQNRYVPVSQEEFTLAAYQLYNIYGEFEQGKESIIMTETHMLKGILPMKSKISKLTKLKVMEEYKSISKHFDAQGEFLRKAILLPFYGSCFFPVCEQRPPLGYFEHRVERWLLGINEIGLSIFDTIKRKYVQNFTWQTTSWDNSPIDIVLSMTNSTSKRYLIKLLTPQAPIIDNVCTRAKYIWAKEIIRENMNYLDAMDLDPVKSIENVALNALNLDDTESHLIKGSSKPNPESQRKFTRVSPRKNSISKTNTKITWKYLWDLIASPMRIKKPGDIPFDLDDGLSNIGSEQELS